MATPLFLHVNSAVDVDSKSSAPRAPGMVTFTADRPASVSEISGADSFGSTDSAEQARKSGSASRSGSAYSKDAVLAIWRIWGLPPGESDPFRHRPFARLTRNSAREKKSRFPERRRCHSIGTFAANTNGGASEKTLPASAV
jgi:hypothetical protein